MKTDIDTIKADIENVHHQIRTLQNETVHCIVILPTGKIQIVDKERLESLNSEVERLQALAGHNSEVAERLNAIMQKTEKVSIADLSNAKSQSENKIADYKIAINRIVGNGLKTSPRYSIDTIKDHPRVKDELPKYEAWGEQERKKLELFTPALEEAQATLQDYTPSGLPPRKVLNPLQLQRATALKEQLAACEI